MDVTPLDLRQLRFKTAMRGYDKLEVSSFLTAVADDYEAALRETERLRQEVARLEAVLNEHRETESGLKATLMAAQKLSDDIKSAAEQEARRILTAAETRSSLLLERTQARVEDVQREIDSLRLKRKDAETAVESTIQALRNTLDFVREQDSRDRDERMVLFKVAG